MILFMYLWVIRFQVFSSVCYNTYNVLLCCVTTLIICTAYVANYIHTVTDIIIYTYMKYNFYKGMDQHNIIGLLQYLELILQ